MIFNKPEFLASILVLDTRYKYLENQNNNLFYLFNLQLDYALAYYFAKSEIIKCNINKFLSNLLIMLISKNLLYHNINK